MKQYVVAKLYCGGGVQFHNIIFNTKEDTEVFVAGLKVKGEYAKIYEITEVSISDITLH